MPDPTPVARILVTAGSEILAVERDDGRGLDIPTAAVTSDVESALQGLASSVLTDAGTLRLLGFVRNTVREAGADYPWPVRVAHFAVWHRRATRDVRRAGRWLDSAEARAQLGERHWWPLVSYAVDP